MDEPARQPIQPFQTTRYTLSSPPTGEFFQFAASSRSGDGLFRFIWTLAPGKRGPGEHVHQYETETFEVISGTLRIWIEDTPHDLRAGDRLAVPPKTRHRFLNPDKVPAVANVTTDGPRLEDTFVPAAVANAERASFGNVMRFMVTTPRWDGSTSTSRAANVIGSAFLGALRLFGVKPFDPVYGWDTSPQARAA